MTVCPERELALHAYLDGELDEDAAVEMDLHLLECASCRAELERLDALSAALRRGLAPPRAGASRWLAGPSAAAPDTLRARVRAALHAPAPEAEAPSAAKRSDPLTVRHWAAAAAVILLTALGGYVVGSERARSVEARSSARELLSSHLRALLPGRLTDVASTDRHQVKPWFAGRLDFAPPVPELAASGFPLVGGRVDFVAGERAAAIVYLRRRHVIDVYILPARPGFAPPASAQAGYALVSWREGPLQLVAISDVDPADLRLFARLHAAAAAPTTAP